MSEETQISASESQGVDVTDPTLPSTLAGLSETQFADALSAILHACSEASGEELKTYGPPIFSVIKPRCTEPESVNIVNSILEKPIATAHDFYLAWTVIDDVLYQLPEDALLAFRPGLLQLTKASQQKIVPKPFSLFTLSNTASDMIRFMDHPKDVWAPQHKGDTMAQRSLEERVHSAEEMRPYVPELLAWLADVNWPPWTGCREQLARFPEESIEPIRHYFQTIDNDLEWLERLLDFVSEFVPPGPLWEPLREDVERQVLAQKGREDDEAESFVETAEEWLKELQKESK